MVDIVFRGLKDACFAFEAWYPGVKNRIYLGTFYVSKGMRMEAGLQEVMNFKTHVENAFRSGRLEQEVIDAEDQNSPLNKMSTRCQELQQAVEDLGQRVSDLMTKLTQQDERHLRELAELTAKHEDERNQSFNLGHQAALRTVQEATSSEEPKQIKPMRPAVLDELWDKSMEQLKVLEQKYDRNERPEWADEVRKEIARRTE